MGDTNMERWPEYYDSDGRCVFTCPTPNAYRAKALYSHARCCGCAKYVLATCQHKCKPMVAWGRLGVVPAQNRMDHSATNNREVS